MICNLGFFFSQSCSFWYVKNLIFMKIKWQTLKRNYDQLRTWLKNPLLTQSPWLINWTTYRLLLSRKFNTLVHNNLIKGKHISLNLSYTYVIPWNRSLLYIDLQNLVYIQLIHNTWFARPFAFHLSLFGIKLHLFIIYKWVPCWTKMNYN